MKILVQYRSTEYSYDLGWNCVHTSVIVEDVVTNYMGLSGANQHSYKATVCDDCNMIYNEEDGEWYE